MQVSDRPEVEPGPTPSSGRPLSWWREVILTLGLYAVYTAIRNNNEGSVTVARDHAVDVMRWQAWFGLNVEETLQDWALHFTPLIIALNYFYGSLHFLVTGGVVIWLFRCHPGIYRRWRNTIVLTTVLALVGFVTWPLMPPRLLPEHGFADTLVEYPTLWSFDSGAMQEISNQYAAMPSLHFAWALFCACALFPRLRHPLARVAACAYPALTLVAIVLTGNHFILDAVGGALVFGAAYLVARTVTPPPVGSPTRPATIA